MFRRARSRETTFDEITTTIASATMNRIFHCFHEITTTITSATMADNAYRFDTTSRLAQWRIDNLASCSYRKSDPFRIRRWNWRLVMEKNRNVFIKLFPELSSSNKDSPPIVSFVIRVVSSPGGRKALVHPEIRDKQLKNSEDFVWVLEVPLKGKFIIDLEFRDVKTASPNVILPPISSVNFKFFY
ncbi:hypothetical protein R6Q59_010328 [Mikania micrantha]|uniref:MATH domain-containing protein n=1 Tax=Mikania micrantha TaxID=192012 RepID=A0A5N6N5V6_9ASTR|nr:hypothetical protein E3N88_25783 [Mikania micrantha]